MKSINGDVTLLVASCAKYFLSLQHTPSVMLRPSFSIALFIIGFYFVLNIMASDDKKEQETLIDMGGKKVPLSKISKPHNVVIGGANKPVPNLENFPSLEPWAQDKQKKDAEEKHDEC